LQPGDTWTDGTNRNQMRGVNRGAGVNPLFKNGEDLYFRFDQYIDPAMAISGPNVTGGGGPWRALWAWPSTDDGTFSSYHMFLYRSNGIGATTASSGVESFAFGR
jgi:hypothetical protein